MPIPAKQASRCVRASFTMRRPATGTVKIFFAPVELPWERRSRHRIAKQKALVPVFRQIVGNFWPPVTMHVRRRNTSQNAHLEEEAGDQGRGLGHSEAN